MLPRPEFPTRLANWEIPLSRGGAVIDSAGVALTQAAVVHELIDRGLLSLEDAVHQGVVVTDASVSHWSAWVDVGGMRVLFVKQADAERSQGRDLQIEAAIYALSTRHRQIADVVPRCYFISADQSLIVLAAVSGPDFSQRVNRGPHRDVARSVNFDRILRVLGHAVAGVHEVSTPPFGTPPWLLVALEPGWGGYSWLPDACADFLTRLARMPLMVRGFRRCAADWRACSVVHGDLRWSNVLIPRGIEPRVVLVDWELACLGDPGWDIGSVFAEVLAAPAYRGLPVEMSVNVVANTTAFLEGYREAAALGDGEWSSLIDRSVRLAGVRLVQMVVECGHQGSSLMATVESLLSPWIVAHFVETTAVSAAYAGGKL